MFQQQAACVFVSRSVRKRAIRAMVMQVEAGAGDKGWLANSVR